MTKPDDVEALDTLVGETRARREALHELVATLRRDQEVWNHDCATLPRRVRLTPAQRQRFRAHLLRLAQRRAR